MNDKATEKTGGTLSPKEIGVLFKLLFTIGMVVVFGITLFFTIGWYLDNLVRDRGIQTYGAGVIVFLLFGVALSFYWVYLKIQEHINAVKPVKNNTTSTKIISNDESKNDDDY